MATMNQIPVLQDAEEQLKLLRARQRTYAIATFIMMVQLGLILGVPVLGGILAAIWPALKAYAAAASLAVIVLDVLLLDRYHRMLMRRAAKIAEQFDCLVLELPWDQFTVGDKVEAEDIHAAARAFAARHDDSNLTGWYPTAAGEVPLHLARIICQRTNLRYDSKLRRSYGAILKAAAILLIGMFVILGLVEDSSVTAWVLTMAPATPFLAWAAREYYRQSDTADQLETLMQEARKLWDRALAGSCGADDCRTWSREFQNAIYHRRRHQPADFPVAVPV
jgi:MFS family permease